MWIVLLTILIFGIIILLHEFGHFMVAKLNDVKVNEFSMGMGPKLFSFGKGETRYSLRLLPIGGFVSMEGEDDSSEDARAFCKKPVSRRILIVVAGACMNLILGFLVLLMVYFPQERIPTNVIYGFQEDAVSSQYGLQAGDEILKINGRTIMTENDISFAMLHNDSPVMDFVVRRDGEKVTLSDVQFQTREGEDGEQLYIDFILTSKENGFFSTLDYCFRKAVSLGKLVWVSLVDLVTGRAGFDQLTGPVGVGSAIGEAASYGWESLLILVAFLTINVGIFNLLPLPALDGGRLLFLLIEAVRRKPVNPKYEAYIHGVGLLLLFALMIFVTLKDIWRLF